MSDALEKIGSRTNSFLNSSQLRYAARVRAVDSLDARSVVESLELRLIASWLTLYREQLME